MTALCRVVQRHAGGYFTHLRDESNNVIAAVEEAIDIARQCGIHVEIVHLKCSGVDNWGKIARVLDMLGEARAAGLDVDCDAYPYTAGSNPLKNLLPQWVQAGGIDAMLARLRDARDSRAHPRRHRPPWPQQLGPPAVMGRGADLRSRRICRSTPAAPSRSSPASAAPTRSTRCADYLIEDRGATRVLVTSIAEDDVRDLVRSPDALVGSDGNCVATYGTVSQGSPHPRFYGTFPRVLGHYAGELGLLPLETAVHKMTGATARALHLADRGLLREGFAADIAIFDPADFKDRATYAQPHQYPSGARTTVIVNGNVVVDEATHTGALPGKVLRRSRDGKVA